MGFFVIQACQVNICVIMFGVVVNRICVICVVIGVVKLGEEIFVIYLCLCKVNLLVNDLILAYVGWGKVIVVVVVGVENEFQIVGGCVV